MSKFQMGQPALPVSHNTPPALELPYRACVKSFYSRPLPFLCSHITKSLSSCTSHVLLYYAALGSTIA